VDSNGEEILSEDNADDESDAENGSDIEVPVVSDDEAEQWREETVDPEV
jgi:hypothetical protein